MILIRPISNMDGLSNRHYLKPRIRLAPSWQFRPSCGIDTCADRGRGESKSKVAAHEG